MYLSNVFLDQLGTNNTNETSVCPVCHGSGAECFACAWRTEEQNSLWRFNAQVDEPFRLLRIKQTKLDKRSKGIEDVMSLHEEEESPPPP